MTAPKNILVALDFSSHSDTALATAAEMAERLDAKLHLLHVFTLQDKDEQEDLEDAQAEERQKLEAAAARLRPAGYLGDVLWHEGDPKSEIVNVAEEKGVDLIVLGATSLRGLKRLWLDDVAESVAKDAKTSVLVVRKPEA